MSKKTYRIVNILKKGVNQNPLKFISAIPTIQTPLSSLMLHKSISITFYIHTIMVIIMATTKDEGKGKIAEILADERLTDEQRKTLREYNKHLVNAGRPLVTRESYLRGAVRFVPFLKGGAWHNITREAVADFMYSLAGYEPGTKENYYIELHRFYKWLGENEEDEEKYTRIVRKERYKRSQGDKRVINPELLLSEEEVNKIIRYAMNPRDKCMLAMSWELGTRPSELLGLNVGDVRFDEYGAVITVGINRKTKTGARTLRVINSLPYLREWFESHPHRDKPVAPLFIGLGNKQFGERIQVQTLRRVFKECAKRIGIGRPVWTYLLRHTSITREANNGLTEQQLKAFYGWSADSRMLKVYSHLTSEDVNKKRLEQAGVIKAKEESRELKQRKCPRCGAENTPTSDFCCKCASPLDEEKYREMLSKTQELETLKTEIEKIRDTETTPLIAELRAEIENVKHVKKEFELKEQQFELKKNEFEAQLGDTVKLLSSLKENPESVLEVISKVLKKKKS
jgi:integrase/recombinase XerD